MHINMRRLYYVYAFRGQRVKSRTINRYGACAEVRSSGRYYVVFRSLYHLLSDDRFKAMSESLQWGWIITSSIARRLSDHNMSYNWAPSLRSTQFRRHACCKCCCCNYSISWTTSFFAPSAPSIWLSHCLSVWVSLFIYKSFSKYIRSIRIPCRKC